MAMFCVSIRCVLVFSLLGSGDRRKRDTSLSWSRMRLKVTLQLLIGDILIQTANRRRYNSSFHHGMSIADLKHHPFKDGKIEFKVDEEYRYEQANKDGIGYRHSLSSTTRTLPFSREHVSQFSLSESLLTTIQAS